MSDIRKSGGKPLKALIGAADDSTGGWKGSNLLFPIILCTVNDNGPSNDVASTNQGEDLVSESEYSLPLLICLNVTQIPSMSLSRGRSPMTKL